MTLPELAYRWDTDRFVRAAEAGVFDRRVELIEGEIWPVEIGTWHGDTVGQVSALLPRDRGRPSCATLPTGDSLPDPDCWVRRTGANPVGTIGSHISVWDPADVLLGVEVSDETVTQDLNMKTRLYGSAGYPVYWVVTRDSIFEHINPSPSGYLVRREYPRGSRIPIGYAGTDLAVDDVI